MTEAKTTTAKKTTKTAPEVKPEVIPEVKPEVIPEVKPEVIPEVKPEPEPLTIENYDYTKVVNHDPKEKVKIRLMKDNGKYKEPLYVAIGDYRALIQRGVEVEVPRFVAQHIKECRDADEATGDLISRLEQSFSEG